MTIVTMHSVCPPTLGSVATAMIPRRLPMATGVCIAMRRWDRLLGILLQLSGGVTVSAVALAARFGVSLRTIYRDVEALSALGVPVFAQQGRGGGFRLLPGYLLPPIMFSEEEAVSLMVGLSALRAVRTQPFADELAVAEAKLLAAVPGRLRDTLAHLPSIVGFERAAPSAFHLRPSDSHEMDTPSAREKEREAIDAFLRAILRHAEVSLDYWSPARPETRTYTVTPVGMFADRNKWYLLGRLTDDDRELRTWRADRVLAIRTFGGARRDRPPFDVRGFLDRAWLGSAIAQWSREHPVRIVMTPQQAERLQLDWYYQHAVFTPERDGRVTMTFGGSRQDIVVELLRWLGPGAELIEPAEWRDALAAELERMLAVYAAHTRMTNTGA
jgi:predicted DNA-binding transcriptional regulator YafY